MSPIATRRAFLGSVVGLFAATRTTLAQKIRLRFVAGSGAPPPPPPTQTQFVGGNIGLFDYTPHPYADLVSGSRGFGYQTTYDESPLISRDSNGWPTETCELVVVGNDAVPTGAHPNGTYAGSYDDSGSTTMTTNIILGCSVSNIVRVGTHVTFDLVVTSNPTLVLRFDGPVRNLSILFPGYSSSDVLRSAARDHFKQFYCLRGMDWMNMNKLADTTWASRTIAGKRHGAQSWEALFAVATDIHNASGSKMKALWINVPYAADATYIANLAALAAASIPAGMILYVEYSNEIWNGSFDAFYHLRDRCFNATTGVSNTSDPDYATINIHGATSYTLMMYLWGLQFARIATAFISAFGGAFGTRVRPVLAGQHVSPESWTQTSLEFLSFSEITPTFGAPSTYTYATGGAPYLFGDIGSGTQMDAAGDAAAVLAGLRTGWSGSLDVNMSHNAAWVSLKTTYGIHELVAYEWGPSTFGSSNTSVKYDAHVTAAVAALITDMGNAMLAGGFKMINYYTAAPGLFSPSNTNSLWPVCQDFSDNSYKLQGLKAVIAATEA